MRLFDCREFAKEKARQTKSGEFHKIREKHMLDDAVKGYLDWINQAGKFIFFVLHFYCILIMFYLCVFHYFSTADIENVTVTPEGAVEPGDSVSERKLCELCGLHEASRIIL